MLLLRLPPRVFPAPNYLAYITVHPVPKSNVILPAGEYVHANPML